ncbi:hypothetical protein [Mycobacterium avium]|uniref:hypothetical protein n=1 Tax=Mycobacterium avium TaxID=1764 RepID=UPI0003D1FDB3|nr:hypothetical protein [Mycobacterium avium]ETB38920.1 hypothetical protein O974_26545 [Mycobacterium avium 11-0986]MBZ4533165.1 hypothetical protein [Mycobacterium avium subsp. hominissuis]MBZ4578352.1 hypothetical protein [Mycobacterium avium subsp. hominissuis]MBZ4591286.1 hypothetical protein [Mycobacterium avium subsp. hominissuis]MBZ4606266.1 hypothetical protein [Mycobacterium avium subsp. hominissuis]
MTAADADAPDTYTGPACQSCGGPCWRHRGSVWGYTCAACIDRHLDAAAARGDARDRRERQKNARKLLERNDTQTPVTADRRRDGGGPDVFRTAAPASATER